jgi:hypothetical protein
MQNAADFYGEKEKSLYIETMRGRKFYLLDTNPYSTLSKSRTPSRCSAGTPATRRASTASPSTRASSRTS